jgi:hypothetical protein
MTDYLSLQLLRGLSAHVTGGSRGIGLCAARALAQAGARVTISGLDAAEAEREAARLRGEGLAVEGTTLDVTDAAACERAAEAGADILVASAGIAWPDTPAEAMGEEAWRRVTAVNLDGAFFSMRAFGAGMLRRGRGSIVAVGSMSGLISNRPQRQAQYNASKAGLHQLVRSLAGEWADRGVRVNAVAPTYVNTPMTSTTARERPDWLAQWIEATPMRRMAEPEEVAAAILFLASPAASAITGAVLPVDAGYTVW